MNDTRDTIPAPAPEHDERCRHSDCVGELVGQLARATALVANPLSVPELDRIVGTWWASGLPTSETLAARLFVAQTEKAQARIDAETTGKQEAPKLTVRAACRKRVPLGGPDAQCLEHALTMTEKERDELARKLEGAKAEAERLAAYARETYEFCASAATLESAKAEGRREAFAEAENQYRHLCDCKFHPWLCEKAAGR